MFVVTFLDMCFVGKVVSGRSNGCCAVRPHQGYILYIHCCRAVWRLHAKL